MTFLIYSLKELLMGLILAVLATIPFYVAQASGVLIDFLRGSSALQVNDPTMQTPTSSIGILYNYVFVVLFYEIGGPFIFLNGIYESFHLIPVDAFINGSFFSMQQPFWKTVFKLLTTFTSLSMQLAAPSLVAILMAEMFLGIANRLAPQVQIAFLGMSLKSLLGIALLWAGWFFILQQLGKQSLIWFKTVSELLHTIPK
jgi:type III secretion protein T